MYVLFALRIYWNTGMECVTNIQYNPRCCLCVGSVRGQKSVISVLLTDLYGP
jgi:hypothetical protein